MVNELAGKVLATVIGAAIISTAAFAFNTSNRVTALETKDQARIKLEQYLTNDFKEDIDEIKNRLKNLEE